MKTNAILNLPRTSLWAATLCTFLALAGEPETAIPIQRASVDGELDGDKARLVISADLGAWRDAREKPIYGAAITQHVEVSCDRLRHTFQVKVDAIQGALREVVFALAGAGDVREVTGDGLEDWSVRRAGDARFLVLRLAKSDPLPKHFSGEIHAETELGELPANLTPLSLTTESPALANGYVRVDTVPELAVEAVDTAGVVPVNIEFLPPNLRPSATDAVPAPLGFRFHGTAYALPLRIRVSDPEARQVVLREVSLRGRLAEDRAAFTLTATALVKNPKGGKIQLLRGGVALSALEPPRGGNLRFEDGVFSLEYETAGEFPVALEFEAALRREAGWNEIEFGVAPSAMLPISLTGLKADTEFRFAGAAKPQAVGEEFRSYLPPNGQVKLAWKEGKPEAEGRLFYAVEALAQVAVSPGLLRQAAVMDFKVMQGELDRVTLLLRGEGEVTRVQGPTVLSWTVEPPSSDGSRRLRVQLNAAQKDQFSLAIQMQRALGTFPQAAEAVQVEPEGATRFGGFVRVVNEGAVRLEVLEASGLSQISPEQIPQTETTRALLPASSTQVFAYRFSGATHRLRVQADNILPELAVSQVLTYHLGETELAIEAEIELDVREAPLREVVLRVPTGYSLAGLNASGASDHFLTETAGAADAQLRIVYGSPVSGRQLIHVRLERNQALAENRWVLPRIEVAQAKSTRGHVGASADAGFRLTPATTQGLTEVATAFFPKQIPGIQAAFRVSDPAWQMALSIERLPQTVQADVFHLFSVGEGIAYGSTVVNYLVSGAPISLLRLELSDAYANVEFTGKNVRSWQRTTNGFQVQLHQAVSGAYTLLATYDRSFRAQGEQLAFTGARPLDAQSEQGYTVVISTYQFRVEPVNVSPSLTTLEPGEVPAEYRLFFDAPILAAYRYNARPFNLALDLQPLAQGDMLGQVVDRAALTTRISEEGQVVTEARYFVKNKGTPHLRLALPPDMELWSVTVNSNTVVPVKDPPVSIIALPQHSDPNTINEVVVTMASKARNARRLTLTTPAVSAPVLLAEWQLTPATERRLLFRAGSLTPAEGPLDTSGFAGLTRLFFGGSGLKAAMAAFAAILLSLIAALLWRSARAAGWSRFSGRHLLTGLLAVGAIGLTLVMVTQLRDWSKTDAGHQATGLRFLAPVQQPDSVLRVEVANVPAAKSAWSSVWALWPVVFALGAWLASFLATQTWRRVALIALGWVFLAWAALRLSNGALRLFDVSLLFLLIHVVVPGLRAWWAAPVRPAAAPASAAATATLLACVLPWLGGGQLEAQPAASPDRTPRRGLAESVVQELRVEDEFVFGQARLVWNARQGQLLPVFREPGVLKGVDVAADAARLVQVKEADRLEHLLVANRDGLIEATLTYETRVGTRDGQRGFQLPTQHGLVNRATLRVTGLDVDVASPQAVSVQRDASAASTNTVATLVLTPANDAWIAWQPRSRDTRREKSVFYAELVQLYVPAAGVIEGLHSVQVRPAQGEVTELLFDIPKGATITDVVAPVLSVWRFDPDTRVLRAVLSSAQARPFALLIKSQVATGPLPLDQEIGLVSVREAADQVGLLGVATGNEVQLDNVNAGALSAINLEDFPATVIEPLKGQVPGLTVRRAFRYSTPDHLARIEAAAVEPDVRVESQQTLSLGEDRVLLAANLQVEITRAGIFKLSFPLPAGMEVETVSGGALSHWTELRADGGRTVTLHLRGKTEGTQQFSVALAGPGARATNAWAIPRLEVREASKHRGQLLVVPEQGLRLQVADRNGVTQLDPAQAGVRQKGTLAFRLLQSDWRLALDLERVDAWIQLTSLQSATIGEAQVKVSANLQYEIENTGVKGFRVRLPANADSVRFRGDQVADFAAGTASAVPGTTDWEVKLHRRVLGRYLLQISYNVPVPEAASDLTLQGVQALDVNLQRGFLTVQAAGRLQVRIENPPAALQPTDWQVIPRTLLKDLPGNAADFTFRLIEAAVRLPVRLDRHEAATLLPARVLNVQLKSVVADDGVMLTQVQLRLLPGDKRLLHLRLPKDRDARFWFAFVNQASVWPWNDGEEILLPLEQQTPDARPVTVEFFYTSRTGRAAARWLDLRLQGPAFDLPLEDITWQVFLSDKWHLDDWTGTFQLEPTRPVVASALDLSSYISNEAVILRQQTQQAEEFLNLGNTLLQQGDAQQARRAFQNAYGLSQHDAAFNEDARVQLQNLKMQQAIVGLNVRQAKVAGEPAAQVAVPQAQAGREGQVLNYTQQEAKQILDRNTAEDNAVQLRLAERLIQQQDAAVASPAAIRATIPEQGRVLTFSRPLEVNRWANLEIGLEASTARSAGFLFKTAVLAGLFLVALVLVFAGWGRKQNTTSA